LTTSTLILRPNADDSVALTPTPSGNHYACVDEASEDTGDYLYEQASTTANETKDVNATDRFGLPDHSSESGVISKVRVKARASYNLVVGTFYAAQIKLGLYISATEYFATAQNLTGSDATYYNEWTTNPNTSAAFTWSDIDNLKALLNLRAAVTAVSDGKGGYTGSLYSDDFQWWIEVDYEAGVYKDIASRFKLIVETYKTIATRFKLAIRSYKDIASRFTVLLGNYKDIAARFYLLEPFYKDIAGRFKFTATTYADIIGRFIIYTGTHIDITSLFKIWAIEYKDIAGRFNLSNRHYQDFIARFVLYAGNYKNIAGRFKTTVQAYKNIAGRFAVYIRWAYKDIATRLKVTVRNYGAISARFIITAISHDIATRFTVDVPKHIILATSGYASTPRLFNRILVMGMDFLNNLLPGESEDTTINGEMLDPIAEPMIVTSADAQDVSDNILAKQRLFTNRGQILVNPNCGTEEWDPIQAVDPRANQGSGLVGNKYRVAGWSLDYQAYIAGVQEGKYAMPIDLTDI
jgi:hypothetical protein